MKRKPVLIPFEGKGQLDRFMTSMIAGNSPDEIYVHPDYFKELCDKIGIRPEDILQPEPREEK